MLIFTIGYGIYFVNEGAGDFTQIILSILRSVLSGVVAGGVIGYMLWAFSKIGSMFMEAGRSIPMLINSAGSGVKPAAPALMLQKCETVLIAERDTRWMMTIGSLWSFISQKILCSRCSYVQKETTPA